MLVLDRAGGIVLQVPGFTLTHGEVCGVYGGSFEGANLFLSCVSGLRQPHEGRIRIYGKALESSALSKYPLGVLPRDGGLFSDLSVRENVRLALRFSGPRKRSRGEQTKLLRRMSEILELERWMETPSNRLPGGVRQRVSLACALAHEPWLLVADDPWGAADIESRELIERALREHCDRGNTLLFASPREEECEGLASEICLFNRTTLVARGTMNHLQKYVDTQESIVVRVQDQASLLVEPISSLSGVLNCKATDRTVTIQASPGTIRLTRLAEHVQSLGLELLDMHIQKPGLSEIYAAVVGQGDDR